MTSEFTVGQPLWNWAGNLCHVTRVFTNTIRVEEFGRKLMTMEMPDISREQLAEVRKTFGMKEAT